MTIFDLIALAFALSMDAMAVSICKGLSVTKLKFRHALITGLYFGGFQAGMPLIGYFLARQFQSYIERVDHWIAFGLLVLIGANMIKESLGEAEECTCSFCPKAMLPMAVATSIDALAVGVTFTSREISVGLAITLIGVLTFSLSALGVYIGHFFGTKFKSKAELIGGIILILLGCKFLVEYFLGGDLFQILF